MQRWHDLQLSGCLPDRHGPGTIAAVQQHFGGFGAVIRNLTRNLMAGVMCRTYVSDGSQAALALNACQMGTWRMPSGIL